MILFACTYILCVIDYRSIFIIDEGGAIYLPKKRRPRLRFSELCPNVARDPEFFCPNSLRTSTEIPIVRTLFEGRPIFRFITPSFTELGPRFRFSKLYPRTSTENPIYFLIFSERWPRFSCCCRWLLMYNVLIPHSSVLLLLLLFFILRRMGKNKA